MKTLLLFILFFITQIGIFSYPKKSEHLVKLFTSTDGLANHIISCIFQDKKGQLWIGTYGGFTLYNGREFRTFTMRNGLSFDAVGALAEDSKGQLWIGTESGLSMLKQEKFENFTHKTHPELKVDDIRSLISDDKDRLYIGTTEGLYIKDKEKFIFVDETKSSYINTIYRDSFDQIWVSTRTNLYIMKDAKIIKHLDVPHIVSMEMDTNKTSILASIKDKGIYQIQLSDFSYKELTSFFVLNSRDLSFGDILINKNNVTNQINFASRKWGLYLYENEKYQHYKIQNIGIMYTDREGNIWVGTYGDGLYKIYKKQILSITYEDKLTDASVRFVYKDSKKRLWIGTQSNITLLENENLKIFEKVENQNIIQVRSILEDSKGNIYFGTGDQVILYNSGYLRKLNLKSKVNVYSMALFEDRLVIAMENNKLIEYNLSNGKETEISIPKEMEQGIIWKLSSRKDWNYVIIQTSNAILKYYPKNSEDQRFSLFLKKEDFKLNKIQTYLHISDDKFVIANDVLIIKTKEKVQTFDMESGLPSREIVSLSEQGKYIWAGTSRGVVRIDEQWQISLFDSNDGLAGDFCNINSIFVDSNNEVFIGTSQGLSIVDSKRIDMGQIPTSVYYSKLFTNDQRQFFNMNSEIELPHNENSLHIFAASSRLFNPEKVKYRIAWLNGGEKLENTRFTKENFRIFYNLHPGKHAFVVQAQNSDGTYSSQMERLEVLIQPAIWQRLEFQIIGGFLFLGILYSVYRFRVYQIQQQNIKLEKLVQLRTRELAEEKDKSEMLLLNILPKNIANRLKLGEQKIADAFDDVSVLFADIVGFTKWSQEISARELVDNLNELFVEFDKSAMSLKVEKIKTIGDCYMCVSGLPEIQMDHAEIIVQQAQSMLSIIQKFNERHKTTLNVRIGIHSGHVVAGVIGEHKFVYDLWGDTVNTASRMESSGVSGKIQVSEKTYQKIKDKYNFEPRGEIEVKSKGKMNVYVVI